MKGSVKARAGVAIGNMRLDGIRMQDIGKGRPKAKEARERLIDGEAMGGAVADQQKRLADKYGTGGSLTDALVKELGGSRTAENQANAYQGIIDNIKAGGRTGEPSGSLAAAAREKMINRQGGNDDTENGGHPDIGKDRANRRAYPKGDVTRKDSAEETAGSRTEARENAKAWANAGAADMKRIIGGKRYALEKRNLLCVATLCNPDALIDFKSKTLFLYFPQGKAFVVDVIHDLTGQHEPPRIITRDEAMEIMDKYPEGIKESVYVRYFGKPEDV